MLVYVGKIFDTVQYRHGAQTKQNTHMVSSEPAMSKVKKCVPPFAAPRPSYPPVKTRDDYVLVAGTGVVTTLTRYENHGIVGRGG